MNNIILSSLNIKGLWNEIDITWKLDPKVNILIGKNGTGKTSLLKSINAAIKENYHDVSFKILEMNFNNNKYIKIKDISNIESHVINSKDLIKKYKYNNIKSNFDAKNKIKEFNIENYIELFDHLKLSKPFKHYSIKENLKDKENDIKEICEYINIVNIVNIDTFDLSINESNKIKPYMNPDAKTNLDIILEELINSFKGYLLKIRTKEKALTASFDKKIKKLFLKENLEKSEMEQLRNYLKDKRSKVEKLYSDYKNFINIVNNFFSETGKTIDFDQNNSIIFIKNNKKIIAPQLSSGEKQILIILLTVLQQENRASIILMDEPELSLHLSWQIELITSIQTLNPNSQLIIATHSPSIFMKGWNDKVTKIEDISALEVLS